MSEEVKVVTDSLRKEANKWRDLASEMAPIKSTVDSLLLGPMAFFMGVAPDFVLHHEAYEKFQRNMAKAVGGAVTEFNQLGDACDKMATHYDQTDQTVKTDLEKIYTA